MGYLLKKWEGVQCLKKDASANLKNTSNLCKKKYTKTTGVNILLERGFCQMANNEKLNPFYGKQNNSVRCPVPGCGHVGTFISKVHCRNVHGMEREEVGELYGYPESLGRGWAMMNDRNL